MLEAVGKEFIKGYFGVIDSVLKESGVACVQVITIPENRFEQCEHGFGSVVMIAKWSVDQRDVDFIRKWIFPGGFLPTVSFVTEAIQQGASNKLVIDSVSNIGVSLTLHVADEAYVQPHYARTLREWRRRFLRNFNLRIAPALHAEHPEMTAEDIEVFKRKWLCESLQMALSCVTDVKTTSVTAKLGFQNESWAITSSPWSASSSLETSVLLISR